MTRTISARRASLCPACHCEIQPGDPITSVDRRWLCAACAETTDPKNAARDWSTFDPSDYQCEARRLLMEERCHLVIEAVAGSGKTTTLEWLFGTAGEHVLGRSPIFLAFNKSIATALQQRLPSGVDASTLNSQGHRMLSKAWRDRTGGKVTLDERKPWRIAREIFPSRGPAIEDLSVADVARNKVLAPALVKLLGLVRGALIDPHDETEILRLIDRHSIEINGAQAYLPLLLESVPTATARDVELFTSEGLIDFDDQLYLPEILDLPCYRRTLVCVDEAQDLNRAQHRLVQRLAGAWGRILAVGDPRQAIYGFRGADAESLPNLISTLRVTERGCKTAPLSVCYRCPSSVLDLARTIVPGIEDRPGAPEGEVRYQHPDDYLSSLKQGDTDLVLCRTNAPLIGAFLSLLRRQVKAHVQGRDLAGQIVAMIDRHNPKGNDDLATLYEELKAYAQTEGAKLCKAGREAQAESLYDRVETVIALGDGCSSVKDMSYRIRSVFADEGDGVVFSTIHRAKGLEADRVAILKPELLPGPWAKQSWELVQEENLEYVAYTRAKERLVILDGNKPLGFRMNICPECGNNKATEDCGGCAYLDDDGDGSPAEPSIAVAYTEHRLLDDLDEDRKRRDDRAREADENEEALSRAREPQEPVEASALPSWPLSGDGSYDPPTLTDWEVIRDRYREAGLSAELLRLPMWRQWALVIGGRVRVSTTVSYGDEDARDKGENAIDIILVDRPDGPPRGGSKKVLRRQCWRGRVAFRIGELLDQAGFIAPRYEKGLL